MRLWHGASHPLGATWDGEGVNFALFSRNATGVELCLFDDPQAPTESQRIALTERSHNVWHGYLPDVRSGQLYGYRVHGPYDPKQGHRFNPNKLLLDPYARAISGRIDWSDAHFGYRIGDPEQDLAPSDVDSAPRMPRCLVVDTAFTWGDDRPPGIPWERTVLYECHVKGMTARHPFVPERLRGTYLGLASDPILDHLLSLGVTAVELMPIHHHVMERHLIDRGLTNYWGYSPIGYFAPDPRFATGALGEQVREFKSMVKAFHRAGIEVILDVVYNHTAEGNRLGPTLSFRGIDNASYYKLVPDDPRYCLDFTGCGNSLDASEPRVMQLVLDSLRHWVEEMHVDGFRFDLASTLGRNPRDFDPAAPFFATLQQDPVLARVKLIAEPWDLGEGGYRLGGFAGRWAEWNDRYRDCVRRFWRGDEGQVPELASRLSGSCDIFEASDRGPFASVNFVTAHDGFTLHDLVTYSQKHNEANGEENRDGHDESTSRNWGVEGETEATRVVRVRERTKRNLLATLAFSQGVPMLSHGDEIGRTQRGNNNAYCQDNELSWVDWELDESRRALLEFTRQVFALRRAQPVFRRRRCFAGNPVTGEGPKDVSWLRPEGGEMQGDDWADSRSRTLGMLIHGQASDEVDERGRPNRGDTLLLLLNGGARSRLFQLPDLPQPGVWREIVNTASPGRRHPRHGRTNLVAHALILLAYEVPR
jgi:glycogen operon protein